MELNLRTLAFTVLSPLLIVAAILVRDKLVTNELREQVLQKLSEDEKQNLEALVRDAIGFRENRGDSITISSGEFVEDLEVIEVPWYENSAIRELLGKLFTILVLAIVTFGALRRLLSRILVAAGEVAGGAPISALADDHVEEGETQQGTMNENLPVPAIVIEEPPEQIEDVAWTYRFLIPTTVAIATLVILGNVIQYFRQVTRKRYKVIEK